MRKIKLPEHLAKLLDTPAKRNRAEKIMAQGRKRVRRQRR